MLAGVGMSRFNPFVGLPRAREVFAWGMYDLANQSFQLLVNTLLFGIFVTQAVARTPAAGKRLWTVMIGASLLAVVVLSPPLGALADARRWKKELLITTGLIAVVLTALLPLLQPGMMWQAFVLYVIAAIAVGLGENFLGAFLPELSTPRTVGRVSAVGWSMSYVGALMLLGITAIVIFAMGITDPARWRWLFLAASVWFLVGMLPAAFMLREREPLRVQPTAARAGSGIMRDALRRLGQTIRQASRFRQLRRFFLVFFVYSLGTYTVIFYAGIIGDSLGFKIGQLTILALVMTVGAGIAAVGAAKYQDRIGHRRTISLCLSAWIASTLALAIAKLGVFSFVENRWAFYLTALVMGLGLGGIGTASRAVVGAFTPEHKAGEFFGVFGMVYKLSGVVGPAMFTAVSSIPGGEAVSLFVLTGFFACGLLLLPLVNESEGVAAASAARSGDGITDLPAESPASPP